VHFSDNYISCRSCCHPKKYAAAVGNVHVSWGGIHVWRNQGPSLLENFGGTNFVWYACYCA